MTPGPWTVERNCCGRVFGVMAPQSARHDLDLICEVADEEHALLIAAAPKLLEACKVALGWIEDRAKAEGWYFLEEGRTTESPRFACHALVVDLRAAIAAAKGQE